MKNIWAWIFGILAGLVVIGLLVGLRADRRAYNKVVRGVESRVDTRQERIDAATEMALIGVDLALVLAGDLPEDQAKADLVKQEITATSEALKAASQETGDSAIARLDQSIDRFNAALQAVEDASREAQSPAVKSILDRIYGLLVGVKEQIVQFILR